MIVRTRIFSKPKNFSHWMLWPSYLAWDLCQYYIAFLYMDIGRVIVWTKSRECFAAVLLFLDENLLWQNLHFKVHDLFRDWQPKVPYWTAFLCALIQEWCQIIGIHQDGGLLLITTGSGLSGAASFLQLCLLCISAFRKKYVYVGMGFLFSRKLQLERNCNRSQKKNKALLATH